MAVIYVFYPKFGVMPGLDPGIHDEARLGKRVNEIFLGKGIMDCRVKPGNDGGEVKPAHDGFAGLCLLSAPFRPI